MKTVSNLPPRDLEKILRAGVLAPSADNSQPWRFELTKDGVRLWVDCSRADSISDVDRVLTHLSCGAVVENMAIQGEALGYRTKITPFPDASESDLVSLVAWHADRPQSADLAEAISKRHTNRRLVFQRRPITGEVLTVLAQEASKFTGVQLLWMDTRQKRRTALWLLRSAERERFRRRVLHAELFRTIRFDVGWRRTVEEGLPPGALEVEAPVRALFRRLASWPLTHTLNFLGLYRALGWRVADFPCRFAPALGLLVTANDNTFFDAGRAMQRVWLRATAVGLAVQPLPAAGILPLQARRKSPAIPMAILGKLAEGLAALAGEERGVVFLRLGWARPPSLVAGRRDPRSFFLDCLSDETAFPPFTREKGDPVGP